MSVERNLLISLLKLSKDGRIERESLNLETKLPSIVITKLLSILQNDGLVCVNKSIVELDTVSRLKIAIRAVNLGADIEHISDFLRWQEFEEIAALALTINGYMTKKNVRFKHVQKRWEIDVIGCRKPLVICIDCKHWHHGMQLSALKKMVESQIERVKGFADSLPNMSMEIECVKWNQAKFVPAILSLIPGRFKFVDNVPIVPVLQLQDFLSQLPAQIESLKYFTKEFSHL